jgi:RNA ligase (TIGR02306 family)
MSIRKLASVQRILDIQPIEGADAIVVATINSWKVVVKKNEFNIGDLVIYCEVDCWIPHKLAPFLSKGQFPRVYDGVEGERLKTVRLRGQISQGLILPLHVIWSGPHINESYIGGSPWDFQGAWENADHTLNEVNIRVDGEWTYGTIEGLDVSERLGIAKYEPPVSAQLAGISLGSFPIQVPKTDEERIQNLTNEWPVLSTYWYETSEKLEGSSMSVGLIGGEFKVCSRNLNLKEVEGNTLWGLARKYDIEAKLRDIVGQNIVFQGEAIGEGIQGNHYGIKGQDFYVFAIYDTDLGCYWEPTRRRELCALLGLKHVPLIDESTHFTGMTIDQVLVQADGYSLINPKVLREGEVFKRIDGQEHFKAVSNKYLLKHG